MVAEGSHLVRKAVRTWQGLNDLLEEFLHRERVWPEEGDRHGTRDTAGGTGVSVLKLNCPGMKKGTYVPRKIVCFRGLSCIFHLAINHVSKYMYLNIYIFKGFDVSSSSIIHMHIGKLKI